MVVHSHKVRSIFAGHSHSAFIDIHNDCHTFGFNQDYRLMIGQDRSVLTPRRIPIRDVKTAALGTSHSAIVTLQGLVFCGGVGTSGELGAILNEAQSGW
jgi:alpha-tubulin suppressor-like RCC1 family protein